MNKSKEARCQVLGIAQLTVILAPDMSCYLGRLACEYLESLNEMT